MATVAVSRLTKEQAEIALATTEASLAAHADICAECRAARDGSGFRIFRVCPTGAEFVRTHLALSHRIHYLAAKARRNAGTQE